MFRIGVVVVTAGLLVSGCGLGDKGSLGMSCEEFSNASEQQQMQASAEWANPARDGSTTDQSKVLALGARAVLRNDCADGSNSDDVIGDLYSDAS